MTKNTWDWFVRKGAPTELLFLVVIVFLLPINIGIPTELFFEKVERVQRPGCIDLIESRFFHRDESRRGGCESSQRLSPYYFPNHLAIH